MRREPAPTKGSRANRVNLHEKYDHPYLSVHAASGVMPQLKLPRPAINVRRSFSEGQWSWVMRTLASRPETSQTRRMRLVLELGATTGLRLIEICTARLGDLRQEPDGEGGSVWLLHVIGKGRRERDVVIHGDIKALMDRHQADLDEAGTGFDVRAPLRTLLSVPAESAVAGDAVRMLADGTHEAAEDAARRPLVGALRRPPPRWVLDANGVAVLDRARVQSDAYGALEPSALYQALKRLFERAARSAHLAEPPLDGAVLGRASTHWLRHFFANSAIEDHVEQAVLREALGHADLATTSVYVKPEQRALLREMAKMRRRG
jgi:site-specific recombinase XerD